MNVTCVYVHVKHDKINEFIKASEENHLHSIKEPGNLRFDFLQDTADPSRFLIYEAYESEEAATAHKNTEHYLFWRDAVLHLMEEPRKGTKYHILFPNKI